MPAMRYEKYDCYVQNQTGLMFLTVQRKAEREGREVGSEERVKCGRKEGRGQGGRKIRKEVRNDLCKEGLNEVRTEL